MSTPSRLALEICAALSVGSDHLRLQALRRLAAQLLAPSAATAPARKPFGGEEAARSFAGLYVRMMSDALGEIELAEFARQRKFEESVATLALLSGLPANASEAAVRMNRRDLLVIVCRSLNFAWSTASLLLDLHPDGPPPDDIREDICEVYHEIAIAHAQRMRRFLEIYFRLSSTPPLDATDDSLWPLTNVR